MTLSITPILAQFNVKNQNTSKNKPTSNLPVTSPMSYSLAKDTVSFTGREGRVVKGATQLFEDCLRQSYTKGMQRYERIATAYSDGLRSIADDLSEYGIIFDKAYNDPHLVKSPDARASKVKRSGTFELTDGIRATLFMKNPYDMETLFSRILPAMAKRGYVVADAKMSIAELMKRGYVPSKDEMKDLSKMVNVPDLDIRLDTEKLADELQYIPPQFRYCVSKPQKSGYEDIQIRFRRAHVKEENPVLHELIVLFGEKTAKNKSLESEKVYTPLRQFGELHFKNMDGVQSKFVETAERYIDLIKEFFTGKISAKLFSNAKNYDMYGIEDEIPIRFGDTAKVIKKQYFDGLKKSTSKVYAELKEGITDEEKLLELDKSLRHDRRLINKISQQLDDTIVYFESLPGGKRPTKAQPQQ